MKYKANARRIWSPILIVIILILSIMIVQTIQIGPFGDYYIFSDISECKNLQRNTSTDLTVEVYSEPSGDAVWNDLAFVEFYGAKFTSKRLRFEIFAYEFPDVQTAKAYYVNAEGMEPAGKTCFYQNTAMGGRVDITVIDGNNAYRVISRVKYYKELSALLSSCFSISVMDKIAN